MTPAHPWRFFRAGGFDQVKLETGADMYRLTQNWATPLGKPPVGLRAILEKPATVLPHEAPAPVIPDATK